MELYKRVQMNGKGQGKAIEHDSIRRAKGWIPLPLYGHRHVQSTLLKVNWGKVNTLLYLKTYPGHKVKGKKG